MTATMASAPKARVGLIQASPVPSLLQRRDPVDAYRASSLQLLASGAALDLIVWPETAVSFPSPKNALERAFRDYILRDRREGPSGPRITVPLLTGMILKEQAASAYRPRRRATGPSSTLRMRNAAVLAGPSGSILGVYAKRILMPLGETALFGHNLPASWFPPVVEFAPGNSDGLVMLGEHRIGISICYEDIHHRLIRTSVRDTKPELLVNLTSDAWFSGSVASELHLALARLRAVEHRRFLVRATKSGVTSVIGPAGSVRFRLPVDQPAFGTAEIRWLGGETPYERVGDAPWMAAVLLTVVMAIFRGPVWSG